MIEKKKILILALFTGKMRKSKIRLQIREIIKRVCFLFFIVLGWRVRSRPDAEINFPMKSEGQQFLGQAEQL